MARCWLLGQYSALQEGEGRKLYMLKIKKKAMSILIIWKATACVPTALLLSGDLKSGHLLMAYECILVKA